MIDNEAGGTRDTNLECYWGAIHALENSKDDAEISDARRSLIFLACRHTDRLGVVSRKYLAKNQGIVITNDTAATIRKDEGV